MEKLHRCSIYFWAVFRWDSFIKPSIRWIPWWDTAMKPMNILEKPLQSWMIFGTGCRLAFLHG